MPMLKDIVARLMAHHQRAKELGGDMMTYGPGEPLMVEAVMEIQRLRVALSPFAGFAGGKVGRPKDDLIITQGSNIARAQLTMGDCRKAAEALYGDQQDWSRNARPPTPAAMALELDHDKIWDYLMGPGMFDDVVPTIIAAIVVIVLVALGVGFMLGRI